MSQLALIPFFGLMGVLAALSACFSAAEAAFFLLRRQDIEKLWRRGWTGRLAFELIQKGELLLTAVLFSNLVVNVAYFAISSSVVLQWQREGASQKAGVFATASVLALIFFSEMLPKSIAALMPLRLAEFLAAPVFVLVRITGPILPPLQHIAVGVRRIFWPNFRPEPYLRVRELELAVRVSQEATAVLEEEQGVLENLVQLSELRAEEVMQPRTEVRGFHPPVQPETLRDALAWGTYLVVVDDEDESFSGVISPTTVIAALRRGHQPGKASAEGPPAGSNNGPRPDLSGEEDLSAFAEPVTYVPWNLNAAQVLQQLVEERCSVAAVINEFGETIGIITLEDLLSRVFTRETSRSQQLFGRRSIQAIAPGVWQVTGLTSVHRLCRYFGLERPDETAHTVAGIFQHQLGRLPRAGDTCRWGPFELRAIQVGRRGVVLAELRTLDSAKESTL